MKHVGGAPGGAADAQLDAAGTPFPAASCCRRPDERLTADQASKPAKGSAWATAAITAVHLVITQRFDARITAPLLVLSVGLLIVESRGSSAGRSRPTTQTQMSGSCPDRFLPGVPHR